MCLIIHKPAGVEVPADLIESAWADNDDGAGIMYMDGPGTGTARTPTVYKVVPGSWADPAAHVTRCLAGLTDREVGIHFRWRTHGPVNEANTHPYEIPGGAGYVMHNGILRLPKDYAAVAATTSDTGFYVNTVLRGAPECADEEFWNIVGEDIGNGNKFLVMDATGSFLRVNAKQWNVYRGLHLSNSYSIPENTNWRRAWQAGDGYKVDYSDLYPTTRSVDRKVISLPGEFASARVTPPPARLTRKERKVFSACLRAGHWGPFEALSK